VDESKPKWRKRAERFRSLIRSDPGDLRIGPVLAVPDVLTEMGVRPSRVFAEAGVDPAQFRDPESRIPFEALGYLFQACVAATGCHHFGLLVGQRFDLNSLGAIGHLMRNEGSVGDALRSLVLHLHLHDRGASPLLLTADRNSVVLGYSIYRHETPAMAQVYDAAVAIGFRILEALCGSAWKPLRVQFSHGRPTDTAPYSRLFGSDLWFEADVSGLVFAVSWLERPVEGADPALRDVLAAAIREAEATVGMSFAERVRVVLHQLILSGTASSGHVAHLFAIHERTLRRRLRSEGTNLQQLVNEARFELAQQLLQNTSLSIAEIAAALQYRDPNAFSRAFRSWARVSPTRWREASTARGGSDHSQRD
jgi:AraC-like DNA-binding protein